LPCELELSVVVRAGAFRVATGNPDERPSTSGRRLEVVRRVSRPARVKDELVRGIEAERPEQARLVRELRDARVDDV
jgi:hypothetical protein